MPRLYTIGYSPHTLESFAEALRRHGVDAVGDVRSEPYSAHKPEFNRESLKHYLQARGIAYVFLGEELGARSPDPGAYVDDAVDYARVARLPSFQRGLERVRQGMSRYVVALMCAEKDPIDCHRTILVSRNLKPYAEIRHILADGGLESQEQAEQRLIRLFQLDQHLLPGLVNDSDVAVSEAYRKQGALIAYRRNAEETVENFL